MKKTHISRKNPKSAMRGLITPNHDSVEPKRSKQRRRFQTQEEEDEYYLGKIQELINEKIYYFTHQNDVDQHYLDEIDDHDDDEIDDEECNKEEQKTVKKKKKKVLNNKKTNAVIISNETTERLKEFITGEMKGSDVKVVIQKVLYATDLAKGQNRLSMPINQLETDEFLTADEKRFLEKDKAEFNVGLLGPTLEMYSKPMALTKWNLKTTSNYVMRTNWNQFVSENKKELKVNTKIQVWSFRMDQQLCFALACVGDENDDA